MTQYLKSLYLCICLLGGFISCQTNESITQDEEIQTIMEGISNQAGQEKNPYLTAGDKTYIIGTQDGNFPDLGGHTPGEMGGVWNHLIKLLDGFWVKMTKAAQKEYPGLPVVCAGGVMSSDIIRAWVQKRLPQVYFVPGQYSSDNAIGVSILAAREAGLWLK